MRRLALGIVFAAVAALTACGPSTAEALVATAEAEALAALGVYPADLVVAETAATEASPAPDRRRWDKRRPQRVLLGRDVLHGEAVVQTKDGPVTVVVQRGEVTAVDAGSVTVKSSDGFTLTWSLHDKLRVVERRATIQPQEVKVGAKVALAGPKRGDSPQARLIVIRISS